MNEYYKELNVKKHGHLWCLTIHAKMLFWSIIQQWIITNKSYKNFAII
jgi:hypothetical protein